MKNIQELIREITICQLSGNEYKFKCNVCGKIHRASSIKSISRCLSTSLQTFICNDTKAEKVFFNEADCALEVSFPLITINTSLPGIPLEALYEKSEELISFLEDYYDAFFEDGNIFIDKNTGKIWYSGYYKYELPVKKPYLLLVEEFEQYVSRYILADYEEILRKSIKETKKFLNGVAHAVIDHIGLFAYNSNLNYRSDAGIELTDIAAKIAEISAKTRYTVNSESQTEIVNLICKLLSSYYRIRTNAQQIKDISETPSYFSYYTHYGNIYALTKRRKLPEMRIFISLENSYSNRQHMAAEKQLLIEDIAREILPIEDIVQKALDAAIIS